MLFLGGLDLRSTNGAPSDRGSSRRVDIVDTLGNVYAAYNSLKTSAKRPITLESEFLKTPYKFYFLPKVSCISGVEYDFDLWKNERINISWDAPEEAAQKRRKLNGNLD